METKKFEVKIVYTERNHFDIFETEIDSKTIQNILSNGLGNAAVEAKEIENDEEK